MLATILLLGGLAAAQEGSADGPSPTPADTDEPPPATDTPDEEGAGQTDKKSPFGTKPRKQVGLRLGVTTAQVTGEDVTDSRSVIGPSASLFAVQRLTKMWSIQPEVAFTWKGGKDLDLPDAPALDRFSTGHVDSSLMLRTWLPQPFKKLPFQAYGVSGAYIGVQVLGVAQGASGPLLPSPIRPLEAGLSAGGGFDVFLAGAVLTTETRVLVGRTNLLDGSVVRTQTVVASAGAAF